MPLSTTPGASLGGIPGSTSLARLLVVVSGNTSGLTKSLVAATSSMSAFQQNASTLGSGLIRSVTLPILGLGGAAIKMASDYTTAMARVQALTSLTTQEFASMNQQIMDLATSGTVITTPKELADSLYFTASAGLDAAQAFQVTKVSAQAMSVGMGDASDISRVLIAALNAFQGDALTAQQAIDALTAAVRAGSAEPAELAVSLGRLLPIAAKVGLTFQETVAQVAALTNVGVPARVATTSLRALFAQFLAPTQQATENLAAFGITAQDMRDAVEEGPLVAFKLLEDATGGNIDVIRNVIPQIRGLTAFLGLTGDSAMDAKRALDAVKNSTGALDKALAIVSKTPEFKFQVALNQLRVAAIQFGTTAMPIFVELARVLGSLGKGLQAINGPIRGVIVTVLALAAAAGPVIKIFGAMQSASGVFLGSLSAMGKGLTVLALSGTIAVASLASLAGGTVDLTTLLGGLIGGFSTLRVGLGLVQQLAQRGALGYNALSIAIGTANATALTFASVGIAAAAVAIAFMIQKSGELQRGMNELSNSLTNAASGGETFKQFFDTLGDVKGLGGIAPQLEAIARSMGVMGDAIDSDNLAAFTQQVGGKLIGNLEHLKDAAATVPDGFDRMLAVMRQAVEEGKDLGPALKAAGFASEDLFSAINQMRDVAGTPETFKLAEAADQFALAYGHAIEASKDFQTTQAATIAAHGMEEEAIGALATKYGVSTDFMSSKLNEFSVNASDLSGANSSFFAQEAGLVDKETGAIVGALAEQAAAEEEAIASRQENLRGSLEFFSKVEDAAKASTAALTKSAQDVAREQVAMAGNVRTLIQKGLDPAVVQDLVDQGPAMVGKFVDASAGELRRLENAYALSMGAVDATILNEGKHQELKGNNMVAGFAEAMLSNKGLPQRSIQTIMNLVSEGLDTGRIKEAGVKAIQDFTRGITTSSNLPKAQAGKIAVQFAQAVARDPGLLSGGQQAASRFIRSFVAKLDLPPSSAGKLKAQLNAIFNQGNQAQDVGRQFSREYIIGINSQAGQAKSTAKGVAEGAKSSLKGVSAAAEGKSLGASFAAGIRSSSALAASAANQVAQAAKSSFQRGLHNSPEVFTYYEGKNLIEQLHRGMREQEGKLGQRTYRPMTTQAAAPLNGGDIGDAIRQAFGDKDIVVNVTTRVDSRDVSRAQYRDNLLRK